MQTKGFDLHQLDDVLASHERAQAKVALLVVENTYNALGGTCMSSLRLHDYRQMADAHQLKLHADGARFLNACVALASGPAELAEHADFPSFYLSKGLAAPFGSVLVGSEAFIERARHYK